MGSGRFWGVLGDFGGIPRGVPDPKSPPPQAGVLWWEQELQGGMGYKSPTPFFHTFVSHVSGRGRKGAGSWAGPRDVTNLGCGQWVGL